MRSPQSVKGLETLGRVRLSETFYLRDFLYSEIASITGLPNVPEHPDLAIEAGSALCQNLLEPLQARFGRLAIRSAYRSPQVNAFGNAHQLNCSSNAASHAGHIWDYRDAAGRMGATACIIVTRFVPYYERSGDWEAMAWWVHDHLPYHQMQFFPRYAAFNLQWREQPEREIYSYIPPRRGWLTRAGRDNWAGRHDAAYAGMLAELGATPTYPPPEQGEELAGG